MKHESLETQAAGILQNTSIYYGSSVLNHRLNTFNRKVGENVLRYTRKNRPENIGKRECAARSFGRVYIPYLSM